MGQSVEYHSFYCPKCGQKTMVLPRKKSLNKGAFHRKKLYCPWCKQIFNTIECRNDEEVFNTIECRNDEEVLLFKEKFLNGEFAEEAIPYEEGLI